MAAAHLEKLNDRQREAVEHGIGLAKRDFMAQAFSAGTLATMRAIKQALDPDGILNPGKVLPEA